MMRATAASACTKIETSARGGGPGPRGGTPGQEQQEDDAELRQRLGARGVVEWDIGQPGMGGGEVAEAVGAEHDADQQEAQHGADARALEQRHDDAGGGPEDQRTLEAVAVQHVPSPWSMPRRRGTRPTAPHRHDHWPASAASMAASAEAAFVPS